MILVCRPLAPHVGRLPLGIEKNKKWASLVGVKY